MAMINRSVSQTIRPINGAMDLNAGKPDPKHALFTAGFTFASILVIALGGLLITWSMPNDNPYARWNAFRVIGVSTGGLLSLFSFRYAWSMGNITINLWTGYQRRLQDWHEAELDMYLSQNGVEVTTEVSQFELTPQIAGHVLLTALAIQHQLNSGIKTGHLPWSVRGLEDKLYLDGSNKAVLIGEITGTRPELMSERLAQLGLVRNRKPGSAGEWGVQSYDQVFEAIAKNWSKLR